MSISILTNRAATIASDNLAMSSDRLQKSLNRLSSGSKIVSPADDAGGLAVSMKMSAAIKRQAASSTNLANTVSYLQTQDGVLKTANDILDRMGELKLLSEDATKNTSDKANYNTEFAELQTQLSAMANETFNGKALFGGDAQTVYTTEDQAAGSAVTLEGVDLLGSSALFEDSFAGSSLSADWTINSGSPTVSGGVLNLDNGGHISTAASYNEDIIVQFDVRFDANEDLDIENGTNTFLSGYIEDADLPDDDWHTLSYQMGVDGTLSNLTLDGATFTPATSIGSNGAGALSPGIQAFGGDGLNIRNFSISAASGSGSGSGGSGVGSIANAADLDSVSIDELKGAIEDVATFRAQNGAQQSRLQFAQEQLTVNQTNLEAASSRIVDVDVAAESTQLARYNILQQAGASMLGQANQSQSIALRLLA